MVVVSPLANLDITILKVLQVGHRKLTTLGNDLCSCVVFHAL